MPFRLIFFGIFNILFFVLCRQAVTLVPAEDREIKQRAVTLAARAQGVLGSRLMGPEYTPITTTIAPMEAKRLSLHPDFAAVAVGYLTDAHIGTGDAVAVNLSGSFPAVNVAVLAAVQAVGAKPVIVSSVGASTWGATDPGDTWLDMERSVVEAGVWPWRSTAASVGGVGDRGGGLSPEGVALAKEAIRRTGVRAIEAESLDEAIAQRMEIFKEETHELPAVLMNVGGSHVFFGTGGHGTPLKEGLTGGYGSHPGISDGLAARFLQAHRSVIHFINLKHLAAKHGIRPDSPAGSGEVFQVRRVSTGLKLLIAAWLASALVLMWCGGRRGWWCGSGQCGGSDRLENRGS